MSTKTPRIQEITATIFDRKGNVLAIGKNSYVKTHTLQAHYAEKVGMPGRIFLHAEIDAIIRCRHLDDAYRIYVDRRGKTGDPLLAKPCPICMKAIEDFTPIKKIEYSIYERNKVYNGPRIERIH